MNDYWIFLQIIMINWDILFVQIICRRRIDKHKLSWLKIWIRISSGNNDQLNLKLNKPSLTHSEVQRDSSWEYNHWRLQTGEKKEKLHKMDHLKLQIYLFIFFKNMQLIHQQSITPHQLLELISVKGKFDLLAANK